MARLELEVGTDVLLLETGDALLLENLFANVGDGAIAIGGSLGLLTKLAIGAGSITISGALSSVLTHFLNVGSGSIAIVGALGLKIKLAIGAGSITIAGLLNRLIGLNVGSASLATAGSLGRKTATSIGNGTVSITGTIGLKVKLAIGGVITSAGSLGRKIAISLSGSITPTGSLSSIKRMCVSVGNGAVTIANLLWKHVFKYGRGTTPANRIESFRKTGRSWRR